MLIDLDGVGSDYAFAPAEVCIVGGGIAGLVLADKLGTAGIDTIVLEAGGEAFEDRSQALYRVEQAREVHTGATDGRFRTYGGTSTRWGGQLLPYTDDVFSPPASTGLPQWPIQAVDIERYYDEVASLLGADDLPYDASLLDRLGHPSLDFGENVRLRYSKWLPFARRNLANTIGKRVLTHASVRVVIHANVARFESENGRVTCVRTKDYAGRNFCVNAKTFVLTAGTIESSRLMLLSGLGGKNAGRYFHDHISMHVAELTGKAREDWLQKLGPFFVAGTLHTCKLEASTPLREEQGSLAAMAHVVIQEPEESGAAAVRGFLRSLQHGRLAEAVGQNLVPMLRGSMDVLKLVIKSKWMKRRHVSSKARVLLNIDLEQRPSTETHIRLSDTVDDLGLQRAVVDWGVDAGSYQDVRRFATVLRSAFHTAHLPEPSWFSGVFDENAAFGEAFHDTFHPMGGLRMGADAATSVVDRDLRVHEATNLRVASCAVFPTGGSSNPTFTMVALTLRLADELIASRS